MKLDENGIGMASGVLAGVWMLVVVLFDLWAGFAASYVDLIADIAPGVSVSYGGALIALVYGLVAGYVFGYIFGWLYNQFVK